jgi:membrane protease YdiL (CAAX protease family)
VITNDLILYISEWLGVIAIIWALRLIPAFQYRPVGFVYPMREGIVSLSLFASMLLVAVVITSEAARFNLTPPAGVPLAIWVRLIVGGIGLLAFGLSMLVRRQPLLSAGWNRRRLNIAGRLALVLGILSVFLRGKAYTITNGFTPNEISMLLVWLGISMAEETIFRGFIQMRLNAWMGERYGWLIAAGLYVAWSVPFALLSPETMVYRMLFVLVQSLLLGYLAQKAGHILPVFVYRAISEWLVFAV